MSALNPVPSVPVLPPVHIPSKPPNNGGGGDASGGPSGSDRFLIAKVAISVYAFTLLWRVGHLNRKHGIPFRKALLATIKGDVTMSHHTGVQNGGKLIKAIDLIGKAALGTTIVALFGGTILTTGFISAGASSLYAASSFFKGKSDNQKLIDQKCAENGFPTAQKLQEGGKARYYIDPCWGNLWVQHLDKTGTETAALYFAPDPLDANMPPPNRDAIDPNDRPIAEGWQPPDASSFLADERWHLVRPSCGYGYFRNKETGVSVWTLAQAMKVDAEQTPEHPAT